MRMGLGHLISVMAFSLTLLLPVAAQSLKIETIDGPPWGFVGSDGKPTGMMYEISNRIAEEAGLRYTNELIPYARTASDIEQGTADFVLRFSNDEMLRGAVPVAVITSMPIIAVGAAGTRFHTLEDLHGKTVGLVRGGKYADAFDNDAAIHKYDANDYVRLMKMVVMKRLDAGVASSVGIYYSAHTAGIKPEELGTPLVLGKKDFVLHFSKKNAKPETLTSLKVAVDKLTRRGEIKKIMAKYMGEYRTDFENFAK